MTDDDAREYRSALAALLQRRELGWIVEQANEKIALGKAVSKRVDAAEVPQEEVPPGEAVRAPRRGPRRMTVFLGTEPFSEQEKLEILLEAIDLGQVSPARMQEQMVKNLSPGPLGVHFRGEETATPAFEFSSNDVLLVALRASRLADAVSKIRALI